MRRRAIAFFLGDAAFLSDPKFRALARRLSDPDEFNSAVGAFWIALAASRRNGDHRMDVMLETDSRFVPDLLAVGLVDGGGFPVDSWIEWDAVSPQQAAAGRARVRDARRDERGRLLSTGPSATSALASLDTDGPAPPAFPSPPLLSSTSSVEGGMGGETADILDDWYRLTNRYPTGRTAEWLTELANEFGHDLVGRALADEYALDASLRTVISRTDGRLRHDARQAELERARPKPRKRESEEERASVEAERRALLTEWASQVKDVPAREELPE